MSRKTSPVSGGSTIVTSWGNGIRDETEASSRLLAREQDTPDLTLAVSDGNVYFENVLVEFAGGNSPTFTAPSSNPRIDILSLNTSGALVRTAGTENASPVAPSVPTGNMAICQVYNRTGQNKILEVDDSTHGYILKELRTFLHRTEPDFDFAASDVLQVSNDAQQDTVIDSQVYTKIKEILLNIDISDVRIKFDMASDERGASAAQAKIYKNGVAIGIEQTHNAVGFVTKTEDFTNFVSGDLIQIFGKVNTSFNDSCHVKNFRFYYDKTLKELNGIKFSTTIAIEESALSATNQDP